MELVERICRLICEAEGVDPDQNGLGCGRLRPRDQTYKLWQARVRVAETLLAAGLTFETGETVSHLAALIRQTRETPLEEVQR